MFETVLLNIGNGYHDNHGLFTAPVSGIYVFSVSMMNQADSDHHRIQVGLKKNGVYLARTMSDGKSINYDQGSFTVTSQLDAGDDVWVAVYNPLTNVYLFGNRYSSFTGFLLAAM